MILHATVECEHDGHVYHGGKRVQFPVALREPGKMYICDLDVHSVNGVVKYYSARKGTIYDRQIKRVTSCVLVNVG